MARPCFTEDVVDVVIRAARYEDATAMGAVWRRAVVLGYEGIFPPSAPPFPPVEAIAEQWRRSLEQHQAGAAILVACLPGPDPTVVGTVAAVPDPEESSRGHLRAMYVDPGFWGRGVGRALHEAALYHFRKAGFRVAALWVLEGNVRARAMYERWGWQSTTTRETSYPGVREVCYLRSL